MRILLTAHPGTNSRDILLDVEAGFRDAGHEVIRWELEPMFAVNNGPHPPQMRAFFNQGAGELVRRLIDANNIDFTMGMWANALYAFGVSAEGGSVPRTYFNRVDIPHVMFWLDAPHWAHNTQFRQNFGAPMLREPQLLNVINNRGTAREMREMLGFGRTLAEPYGVNTEVFRPAPGVPRAHDFVINVGPGDPPPTDRMLRELESDEPDLRAIRADLAPGATEAMRRLATEGGIGSPAMEALIDAWVASQLDEPGVALPERFDAMKHEHAEAIAALRTRPAVFVTMADAARSIDQFRRAFLVTWLSSRFDVAVFGVDPLKGWPHRATMIGPVPYDAMSGVYARGRLALNVMRWQDDVGLNLKPLEITASGVPCLCERRAGLDGLFEIGTEIESFDSPATLARTARVLLADEDRRVALAEAGRARTVRDHTWARWASSVCRFVRPGVVAEAKSPAPADAAA